MDTHHNLPDYRLEMLFEQCSLPSTLFTHEAHLRLAWIHITKYGINKAILNLCTQIKDYARSLGYEEKYNQTLTVASVKTVNHFIQKSVSINFEGFIAEFPQLKYGFKLLLETHYGFDIFSSEKAKTTYLEPDLLPFE